MKGRDQWIEYLDQKEKDDMKNFSEIQQQELFQWAATKIPLSVDLKMIHGEHIMGYNQKNTVLN